jgi:hypothetical protein
LRFITSSGSEPSGLLPPAARGLFCKTRGVPLDPAKLLFKKILKDAGIKIPYFFDHLLTKRKKKIKVIMQVIEKPKAVILRI